MSRRAGITLMELLVAMTLLSLLSVGVLFGLRIGLNAMERSNDRLMTNRRVLGVERVITQQIAGFMPVRADCLIAPDIPPRSVPFFQGEAQTMRFVSTYSLDEASRGYARILEYQVIPGENGVGVRLIVNELLYTGPLSTGSLCAGIQTDPTVGTQRALFRPVQPGPASFVLADKLAHCQFFFQEQQKPPEPDLWVQTWVRDRYPGAIRIEMRPLSPDPSRLEVPAIVVPIRVTRNPKVEYLDYER